MQRFGTQHVNESQTLPRAARNHFHTTLPLIRERKSRKRLVLVKSKPLGTIVNTLTVDCQYFR